MRTKCSFIVITLRIIFPNMEPMTINQLQEKSHYRHVREEAWVVCEIRKEPPSPVSSPPPPPSRKAPKPVDEDLYNLSPELLHSSPKRVSHEFHIFSCVGSKVIFYYSWGFCVINPDDVNECQSCIY